MIKGKTIIELTDVHTGEVERHEDNNMVTNALNKIFEPLGYFKIPSNIAEAFLPLYEKALGGILLFDGHIEENADTLFAPATVKMTGCGVYSQQNTTNFTYRGNFNVTESEIDIKNKFAKYVYDFPTSIANGTIACVCLTSKDGGCGSYGFLERCDSRTGSFLSRMTTEIPNAKIKYAGTTDSKEYAFFLNKEADIMYCFMINSLTSITIIKRKAYMTSISAFDNPGGRSKGDIIDRIDIDVPEGILKSVNYMGYNYDQEEGALYVTTAVEDVPVGGEFSVLEYYLEKGNLQGYNLINTTEKKLRMYRSSHTAPFVYKKRIYFFDAYNSIYSFSITSPDDYYMINNPFSTSVYFIDAKNGLIFLYVNNSTSLKIINTHTKELLSTELNHKEYDVIPVSNSIFLLQGGSNHDTFSYAHAQMNYLATINNLSTPVVKTADKTMKVTYIIQEVAE